MMDRKDTRILVVDDEQSLLDSYRFVLNAAGYPHSLATGCGEALGHLARETHHVALVDLRLKNEDGIEVISRMKEVDPDLECIMITAYPSYETAVQALKLGAFDYLSKTAEPETILDAICEAAAQRELRLAQQDAGVVYDDAIRLVVVCDNTLLKKGIADMVRRNPDLTVSGFYYNFPQFIRRHPTPPPDIIMMCGTCNFQHMKTGQSDVRKARMAFPQSRIAIFNQKMTQEDQIQLLKMGVGGFLETDASEARTVEQLRAIHRGDVVAPPTIIMRALKELADESGRQNISSTIGENLRNEQAVQLTRREKEIVRCIARGLRNKEIAEQLFISEKTVKTHINNIFRKLGVENRLQAIQVVYERNLLV